MVTPERTDLTPGNVEFLPVPPGFVTIAPTPNIIGPAREPGTVTSQAVENPRFRVDPASMNATSSTVHTFVHGAKSAFKDKSLEEEISTALGNIPM